MQFRKLNLKIDVPLRYRPFLRRLVIGVVLLSPMVGFSNREQVSARQANFHRRPNQIAAKKQNVNIKNAINKSEQNLKVEKF